MEIQSNKNHFVSIVEAICVNGLGLFCTAVIMLIFFYNMRMTSYPVKGVSYFVEDSMVVNILVIVLVLMGVFVACRVTLLKKLGYYFFNVQHYKFLKKILLIIIFSSAFIFAVCTQYIPGTDAWGIQTFAHRLVKGDYSVFAPGAYMNKYPNQWGFFIYVWSLISIFGANNYMIFQVFNAFAICMIYKQLTEIMEICIGNNIGQLVMLIVGCLFFPLQAFSIMVYGNVIGMAFAYTAIKYELLYFKTYRRKEAIVSAISIALAVAMKSNMEIHLIAMVIYALIKLLRCNKKKTLFLLGMIILCVGTQTFLTERIVETVSGYKMENPCSYWAFIAMGLQENDGTPGWWTGYEQKSYEESGHNTEVQAILAKENIKDSLKKFMNDPEYAFDFFSKKLSSIWSNPSYECFRTPTRGGNVEIPRWIYRLLGSNGQYKAMKLYHVLVLVILEGSIIALVLSFGKRELFIDLCIMPMIIVGGFLFHLFWEAKAVYAIYYFVALIPYAFSGYVLLFYRIQYFFSDNKSAFSGSSNIIRPSGCLLFLVFVFWGVISVLYSGKRCSVIIEDTDKYYEYLKESQQIEDIIVKDKYIISSPLGALCISVDDGSESDTYVRIMKNGMETPITINTYNGSSYLYAEESKSYLISEAGSNGESILIPRNSGEKEQSRWTINRADKDLFYIRQGDKALTYDIQTGEVYLRTYTESFNQLWSISQCNLEFPETSRFLGCDESEELTEIARNLHKIDNINEYLSYLDENKSLLDIFIAVKDIQGFKIKPETIKLFEKLGISEANRLLEQEYHSCIFLISQGKIQEQYIGGDESIRFSSIMDSSYSIEMESATLTKGNSAKIVIDGIDYAVKGRGYNIVVAESETGRILDSVVFDAYLEGLPCMR